MISNCIANRLNSWLLILFRRWLHMRLKDGLGYPLAAYLYASVDKWLDRGFGTLTSNCISGIIRAFSVNILLTRLLYQQIHRLSNPFSRRPKS